MNKTIACILFTVSFALSFQSSGKHANGWLRTTGSLQLMDKWRTDIELQGRWQNGLHNTNPLKEKLLFSYRHWFYYRHGKSLQFGLSPLGYYNLYKIIESPADYHSPPLREYRLSLSADLRHQMAGELYATMKAMVEYRMFDNTDNVLRLRNKFGLEYAINRTVAARVSHELLVNAAGTSKQHFFDHQRSSLSAVFNYVPGLSVEMGYTYVIRLPLRSVYTIAEDNLFINATILLNTKNRKDK